jgi:hypothetical protein
MRSKTLMFGGLGLGAVAILGGLASCSDPRGDEAVVVIDKCDRTELSTDPTNAQSSLKAYLEATDDLVKKANEVETVMKDACNALNMELGMTMGADSRSACGPLSARFEAIIKKQPPPPFGSTPPDWVQMRFSGSCAPAPTALDDCLKSCAGPCDATKCETGKLAGKCMGTCKGTCATTGADQPCVGRCVGESTLPEGGTCQGECRGACLGNPPFAPIGWAGNSSGSCGNATAAPGAPGPFSGLCLGTCTGTCDGNPVSGFIPDGGLPDGGPPPGGNPGNCKGYCKGHCRSDLDAGGSSGDCLGAAPLTFAGDAGPPFGSFAGGACSNGFCTGRCESAQGSGTTATCTGICTQSTGDAGSMCNGICRGGCEGSLTEPICEGARTCGQNAQCNNACQAKSFLSVTCGDPRGLEVVAISDPPLYAALLKHAAKLAKASSQLSQIRTAFGFVGNVAYGDFVALNLSGDLVRACVSEGQKNSAAADAVLRGVIAADPTTRKYQ